MYVCMGKHLQKNVPLPQKGIQPLQRGILNGRLDMSSVSVLTSTKTRGRGHSFNAM